MSTSTPPQWKLVENVVTAIERSLNTVAGTKVIPNASVPERIGGLPRQVDVYVEIPTGPRTLRIGVEVRDKTSPLDLPEVEQLVAKLKKLDLDYGCIVSRSGYTASAKQEAERNGIELRTVRDIDNPNWWLASGMSVELLQVELVQWKVNFRPEELPRVAELLAGVDGTEVEMTLTNGESGTLHALVVAEGLRAVDRPQFAGLKDQDIFMLRMDFSQLQGASLTSPRGPVPLPQNVHALYRLHRRIEFVELVAYQGPEGVNAFSGISSSLGKQVTLVTKLQEDGARRLFFTADNPRPSTMKIDPRK